MNLISFSIWGNDPFYVNGIAENFALAKEHYPGFKIKIFHDNTFNINQVSESLQKKIIFEKIENSKGTWDGLFWRFYPASDPDVNVLLVRDLDSRLNSREAAAVKEWLESDRDFHGMRDHIEHNVEIMGGMWGVRNGLLKDMTEDINNWKEFNKKGTDQEFLSKVIWPKVKYKCIVHDKYYNNLFVTKDKKQFTMDDIQEWNPYDNCGDENNPNFPRGRIIFKDGTIHKRDEVYEYLPLRYFGPHLIRPFPIHNPISHGTCVGDYVR